MKKKQCELSGKNKQFVTQVDFKEQTPEVATKSKKQDPLYEKAFLTRDDQNTNEYAKNTTTWD